MNAKPNDICRIVGVPDNQMSLVTAVRPVCAGEWLGLKRPGWICETLTCVREGNESVGPGAIVGVGDANLRPLHDGDATDEIVALVGKPARSPLAKVCDPQPVVVGAPAHGEVG